MLDVIQCPKCKRPLHFSDGSWEHRTQCPTCGEPICATESLDGHDISTSALATQNEFAVAGGHDSEVEVVPIKLSLNDRPGRRIERVPPPPAPFRVVQLAPTAGEADDREQNPATICPCCRKRVALDADRCHSCGQPLDERGLAWTWDEPFPPERRDYEPDRGGLIITLGILGVCLGPIGLPFAIAAWVMGNKDLEKMRSDVLDPAGSFNTADGRVCGMIGTFLGVAWVLLMGCMMVWL